MIELQGFKGFLPLTWFINDFRCPTIRALNTASEQRTDV